MKTHNKNLGLHGNGLYGEEDGFMVAAGLSRSAIKKRKRWLRRKKKKEQARTRRAAQKEFKKWQQQQHERPPKANAHRKSAKWTSTSHKTAAVDKARMQQKNTAKVAEKEQEVKAKATEVNKASVTPPKKEGEKPPKKQHKTLLVVGAVVLLVGAVYYIKTHAAN